MKLLMFTAITNNWSNCTVLCVKKGRITGKDMTSWFSSTRQRTIAHVNNDPKLLGDTQLGSATHPAFSPDLAPSNYHLFSLNHAPRATRSLSGTSILTKTSENGLMSGLPRKMRNFFGVVYTNCPKDGKNI